MPPDARSAHGTRPRKPRRAAVLSAVVATVTGLSTALWLTPACQGAPGEQPAATATSSLEVPIPAQARGMWVWGTRQRLARPDGVTELVASARAANLNEVYLSVEPELAEPRLPELVTALHDAGMRVEALTGDAQWYLPERRSASSAVVDAVAAYNTRVPAAARFAGVHFDIEPHQLPQNKGNHAFLPALAEALRLACARAAARGLGASADLPRFALQENGPAFAAAVPRIFVMLYELRDRSPAALADASARVFDATYAGSPGASRGKLVVGLSVDDYPTDLGAMLSTVDTANRDKGRYAGWAIHDEARYRARVLHR
jgi:hypothetical protein